MPSKAGFAPAAMRMKRPVSVSSPTRSLVPSRKCVRPWNIAIPASAYFFSLSSGTGSVKVFLKPMSDDQSIFASDDETPLPFIRRSQSNKSAAPTRTFLGSQPRSAHVPPNGLESTMATSQPASRHLNAAVAPAAPVPITTRSKFFSILFATLSSLGTISVPRMKY
jgi:hypothetical protein